MSQPSYLSEPHVQFLSRSLEEMRSGLLRIPRFQRRPLVWDVDRRLELLRSIRDGIPIGSILIWRTGLELASLNDLGPHQLASPSDKTFARQYILDGLQRLSSLYAALMPVEKAATGADPREGLDAEWQYETYFDLEQGDFVMLPYGDAPSSGQLPLTSFLDNVRYRRVLRRLPDEADRWIEAADRVSSAFQEYKIAIVPVVGDDLDLATRTFHLVNSQGTPMSYAHMVHARTWRESFDLHETMDRARAERLEPIGWRDVPDERILDACKACSGLDLYETEAEKLSRELRSDTQLVDRTVDAMARAVTFLRDTCHVPGPKALPYSHQLTLLAMAFYLSPEPPPEVRDLLEAWFWLSTSAASLTGISGYRMSRLCQDLAKLARGESRQWPGHLPLRWKPLPSGSDFRTVRTKAIALMLARRAGPPVLAALGREGAETLFPILPRKTPGLSADHFGRVGNRIVCEPAEADALQRAIRDGTLGEKFPDFEERFVLPNEVARLMTRDPNGFVAARHRALEAMEREHASGLSARFGFGDDAFR